MRLSDINFEEFVVWVDKFETVRDDTEELLLEAGRAVPVIDRLFKIMCNAKDNNGPENMIRRVMDQIQCLAALYHIEKGKDVVQNN
jgi:hypothetical protein